MPAVPPAAPQPCWLQAQPAQAASAAKAVSDSIEVAKSISPCVFGTIATMVPSSKMTLLRPATSLEEVGLTLDPAPLLSQEEIAAFYRKEVQQVRGEDRISLLSLGLQDALRTKADFKGFLLGHPGVGKTTELMRVVGSLSSQLQPLRISVLSELNPGALRYYDILLLILLRLVQETSSPVISGSSDNNLEILVSRVRSHLSTKWTKHLQTTNADWGTGIDIPFLKLFGNLRQGRSREVGEQEYEVSFVSELTELMNDVLEACNHILQQHKGKQWIVLVEDFDKLSLPTQILHDVFQGLRPSLQSFRANLIITIPLWLYYSDQFQGIQPYDFKSCVVPDISVYTSDHVVDSTAVDALKAAVYARMNADLLAEGVLDRCILASGGFLRDLFYLIREATMFARIRSASKIEMSDANKAILEMKNNYKQRLGSTLPNPDEPSLDEKLKLLVEIYHRKDSTADIANSTLYNLLRQRFVLQCNGVSWMGVHPLAVDLLMDFRRLPPDSPGGSKVYAG